MSQVTTHNQTFNHNSPDFLIFPPIWLALISTEYLWEYHKEMRQFSSANEYLNENFLLEGYSFKASPRYDTWN